jgi:DNA repair protein RadC
MLDKQFANSAIYRSPAVVAPDQVLLETVGLLNDGNKGASARSLDRKQARIGPRERIMMNGPATLSDADLLAVLLGTGLPDEPVGVLAARLLETAGGLDKLERLGVSTLAKEAGIGPGKACRLKAAFEIGKRVVATPLMRGKPITCSRDVVSALKPRLSKEPREHFVVIALDLKNRPISEFEVALGSLGACAVKPADVFRAVLRESSAAIVLVHNHPSGEPSPSTEDVAFTKRIKHAGELIGIRTVDHIIIGEPGYFSFLDSGLLAVD